MVSVGENGVKSCTVTRLQLIDALRQVPLLAPSRWKVRRPPVQHADLADAILEHLPEAEPPPLKVSDTAASVIAQQAAAIVRLEARFADHDDCPAAQDRDATIAGLRQDAAAEAEAGEGLREQRAEVINDLTARAGAAERRLAEAAELVDRLDQPGPMNVTARRAAAVAIREALGVAAQVAP